MKAVRAALSAFVVFALASTTPAWAAPDDGSGFDRQAAANVLSSVDLSKCRVTNAARGDGHVMVTYTTSGSATKAFVDKGPMAGTPVAKCIAGMFMKTKVPSFQGTPSVQVGKTFHFE